jgi:hypothetical protein
MFVFKDEKEVIDFVKANQTVLPWVTEAREMSAMNRALVYGDDFQKKLIEKIEKIESADRALARKKYSKDIRDTFKRFFEPRSNVFSASGGDFSVDISSEQIKEKFLSHVQNYKGNKSVHKYLSEYFFKLLDVDPNGLIFTEYEGAEKIYPTYKSINDIRVYKSDGQNVEYVLFEPKQVPGTNIKKWRVVDSKTDWCVIQNGTSYVVSPEKTFEHPFGIVPAVILSDHQKLGTELRLSPLFEIQELGKDYARDKSVLTLYKFIQGFPIHWRYTQICRVCHGTGKVGDDDCHKCSGKGHLGKNDVTDILELPMPHADDPKIAPDLAGFVSPDLETWKQYREELKEQERLIEDTIWGTHRQQEKGNETATGKFIDVQPVLNRLNDFADNVEWVHNELLKFVLQWSYNNSEPNARVYKAYGRGFIIESPDELLKRYESNRKEGSNLVVLDKLLNEYLSSKYRNNPQQLEIELKKCKLEPYLHLSFKDVREIFGDSAVNEKKQFAEFWKDADKQKTVEQLQREFDAFKSSNP